MGRPLGPTLESMFERWLWSSTLNLGDPKAGWLQHPMVNRHGTKHMFRVVHSYSHGSSDSRVRHVEHAYAAGQQGGDLGDDCGDYIGVAWHPWGCHDLWPDLSVADISCETLSVFLMPSQGRSRLLLSFVEDVVVEELWGLEEGPLDVTPALLRRSGDKEKELGP